MAYLKALIKDAGFGLALMFILAAIGLACITVPIFGSKALVVRSGSMEPAIKVGDLIAVRKLNQGRYTIGDVIAFKNSVNPKVVTSHRIVSLENLDGQIFYQTKGDANSTVDKELVSGKNIIGKVHLGLPYVGRLIAFTKTNSVFGLLIALPAIFVIVMEFFNIFKEVKKQKGERYEPYSRNSSILGFKALIPLTLSVLLIQSSFAYFTDTETSTVNVFEATDSFGVGAGDIVINEINWVGSDLTGQTGQNDEWLELRNTTSGPINLAGWKITGAITGDGDLNIPSGIIPANGFFLISNFNETTSRINVAPDLVTTAVQLDNANAQYILKDNLGNTIDTADDDSGVALAGTNGPPKRSMERKTPPGDGTQGANWQDATTHTNMDGSGPTDEFGTPKAPNGT